MRYHGRIDDQYGVIGGSTPKRVGITVDLSKVEELVAPDPIEKAEGAWKQGDNYMGYSAIAFSFAYRLFQELDVPIGILNCSFTSKAIAALQ